MLKQRAQGGKQENTEHWLTWTQSQTHLCANKQPFHLHVYGGELKEKLLHM